MLCLDHWVLWSDSISDILLWHCHSIKTHFLLTSSDFGGPEEFEGQLTFNMNHAVIAPFSSPAYKLEMANRVSPSKRSFHVFRSCSTSPRAPPQLQECVCVCLGFSVCECMGVGCVSVWVLGVWVSPRVAASWCCCHRHFCFGVHISGRHYGDKW